MKAGFVCSLVVMASTPGLVAAQADEASKKQADPPLEGVIALGLGYGADYLGGRDFGVSVRPGLFLRWGRFSASSGASWAARRQEVEQGGLGLELSRSDAFDLILGLRSDSGRRESASPALAGMGDVKRTLRLRLSAAWRFAPQWQVSSTWTGDMLGRGGGSVVETKLQRQWSLSPATTLEAATQLTYVSARYMRSYFGVSDEQAAHSGYVVYQPGAGWRSVSGYVTLKSELGGDWVVMAGPGFSTLLGQAADSPLTQRRSAVSFTAGVGWRF
jgi:outer membrane scaffolding protein for murein synthesis (MipA/OmpV family)